MASIASRPTAVAPPRRAGGTGLVVAYVVAYFALYVALLTPVMSTHALRVSVLSTPEGRAGDLALVAGVGAFFIKGAR